MDIIEVELEKIKPDSNQPRKDIDEDFVKILAQSVAAVGILKPIELDKDLVIITGELRWRAAKMAGLKTIPAVIMDIAEDKRFMRQVSSNLYNERLPDYDLANALKKLLLFYPGSKDAGTNDAKNDNYKAIIWLSKKIGKSCEYIEEKISILKPAEKNE